MRSWSVVVVLFTLVLACASPAGVASPRRAASTRVAVGTSGDYAPLSVARGDRFEGFAPSIVSAFAASRAMDVAWSRFRWTELDADLRAGRFEMVADGITVRPERSIAGRFTVPIARGGAVLLLRRPPASSSPTYDALDRPDVRIAVNRGGHLERVTRLLFGSADVRAIADNGAVRDALVRGEVDAVMTNTFEAPRWAEGIPNVERIGPLTNDVTALWVRADREDLAVALDTWLLEEERSGRLGGLRAKELGAEGAGPRAALVASAISAAMAERLSLMPFVAAAKKRAGLAIEDASQEERVLGAARTQVATAAKAADRRVPSPEAVDAFFRLQIEAAKSVQARGSNVATEYDLDRDLRPAIARISARLAWLLVRVPRGLDVRDVTEQLRGDLKGLDDVLITRLARAIVALG